MDDVQISTIMTREVAVVAPDSPLTHVIRELRERHSNCAVVCEDGIPTGIITHGDLAPALETTLRGDGPAELVAMDVMSFPPFALAETELMSDAMALVQQRGLANVPVVSAAGTLVGMIRLIHLLGAHAEQLDAKRASLEKIVAERTAELVEANERLRRISLQDPLMGIGNRRAMHQRLAEIHERARREGTVYSVVMLDLDCFKAYNDLCGHLKGDEVLLEVVSAIRGALRELDDVYRYGGEELLTLLPGTGLEGALEAASRIRANIEARGIPHPRSPHPVVTVSAGVATAIGAQGVAGDWSQVVSGADAALYRAKDAGRNRVCK